MILTELFATQISNRMTDDAKLLLGNNSPITVDELLSLSLLTMAIEPIAAALRCERPPLPFFRHFRMGNSRLNLLVLSIIAAISPRPSSTLYWEFWRPTSSRWRFRLIDGGGFGDIVVI